MHHVLKTMISHYLSDEYIEWDEMIPFVLMAYRSRIHEATRETPFFLLHGRDMELPFHTLTKPTRVKYDLDDNYVTEMLARMRSAWKSAAETIEVNNQARCDKFNRKAKAYSYQPGDKVYLHTPAIKGRKLATKFQPKRSGPYRILKQTGHVNYVIKEIGGKKESLVHVSRLKPWRSNQPPSSDVDPDTEDDVDFDPTQQPLLDSQMSKPHGQEPRVLSPVLESYDGFKELFAENTDEEEANLLKRENQQNQRNEIVDEEIEDDPVIDEADPTQHQDEYLPLQQEPEPSHPYQTRSKGDVPEYPWVLRRHI